MSDKKKLLIIDAFSLIFRAFYSYPPTLTLQDGTPINAAYGFIAMLFKAIDQFSPEYVCVCFDRKEPTFRSEIYPEYKAHRPEPPDEFKVQVPHILELVEKMSLPWVLSYIPDNPNALDKPVCIGDVSDNTSATMLITTAANVSNNTPSAPSESASPAGTTNSKAIPTAVTPTSVILILTP